MDPRRLLTFRVVAHERSFTRAAEKLSLSQPSVSHQVAALETEIGLQLLDRGRGGLRLTEAGGVLLEHADRIAWRLEMAESQIARLAKENRAHVRLGAFPTALTAFVPAAVGRLRSAGEDLHLRLSEVPKDALERRFSSGEFDLAIGYQDSGDERVEIEGAERVDLLRETFLIGMSPTHRLAGGTGPIPLSEFAEEEWILPSESGFLADACRDAGFEPRVLAITRDPIASRGLIAHGLAVGWVPSLLAADFTDAVMRPVAGEMRHRDVFALLPPGGRHPLAGAVLEALVETGAEFDARN